MSLPRLRIRDIRDYLVQDTEVCDLDRARDRIPFGGHLIVIVDGQVINSYEELVSIAARQEDGEAGPLDVVLLRAFAGG